GIEADGAIKVRHWNIAPDELVRHLSPQSKTNLRSIGHPSFACPATQATGATSEYKTCLKPAERRQAEVQAPRISRRVVVLQRNMRPDHCQIAKISPKRRRFVRRRGSAGPKHQINRLPAEPHTLLLDLKEPAVVLITEGNPLLGVAARALSVIRGHLQQGCLGRVYQRLSLAKMALEFGFERPILKRRETRLFCSESLIV